MEPKKPRFVSLDEQNQDELKKIEFDFALDESVRYIYRNQEPKNRRAKPSSQSSYELT